MASLQVTCHTPDEMNAERRIRGLGGQGWWFPTDSIIQMIENQQHEFWISIGQERVELAVGRHGVGGRTYLTTGADEFPPKALLSLPICQTAEAAGGTSDKSRWAPVR
jgi:hypothetical protein